MSQIFTISVLSAIFFSTVVFLLFRRHTGSYTVKQFGSLALFGHFVISTFILPLLPYQWDIGDFHQNAVNILQGIPVNTSQTIESFATFQALVYAVFGTDPTTVAIINGLLAVLIVIPVADLAKSLYPDLENVDLLMGTLLFLPLPFLFSSLPMRDTLDIILFFCILAGLARAYTHHQPWYGLLAVPLFGALAMLRPELAFIITLGTGVAIAIGVAKKITVHSTTPSEITFFGGVAGTLLLPVIGPRLPVETIRNRMEYRTAGGAAYLEASGYESWIDVVLSAPTRAIYFQFAPFPLHVTSIFDLLALSMLPFLVVIAIAAYRSASQVTTNDAILFGLATVYITGIFGYGLIDANFGTTVRHRIPFTFLLCVFAAPVFARWERSIRQWLRERPRYRGS